MKDNEIVQRLIDRDVRVTQEFFFKRCNNLFRVIIEKVFPANERIKLDYDKLINDFYNFLMANDAKKLRGFKFTCSFDGWLKRESETFFMDKRTLQRLIDGDKKETSEFFLNRCKKIVEVIVKKYFPERAKYSDYDEEINELYVFLMKDKAKKLTDLELCGSFDGWLYMVARNYLFDYYKKNSSGVIDYDDENSFNNEVVLTWTSETRKETEMDFVRLLNYMPNRRYADVLRKLICEDMSPKDLAREMDVNEANLYNIKKRAIAQLTRIAINDIKNYNK